MNLWYSDIDSVKRIKSMLNEKILQIEIQLESIKQEDSPITILKAPNTIDEVKDNDVSTIELGSKKQVKVISRSLKFLNRCSDELAEIISKNI